ncbi:MAG TPA: DUF4440 domain-containing protein [Allosphingosinicella sp.]|uniref:YybH family protein n=1 Tax=Allosphingosinicella sp. TaxID=2823234 RepID=UPI002ED8B562
MSGNWQGRRLGAALILALATIGCATTPAPTSNAMAEAEVRAALDGLVDAFEKSDGERIVSYLSRDLHLIHPTRGEVDYELFSTIRNRKPPADTRDINIELDHLYVSGDLAVTGITWRTTITAPDGKVTLRGERDQEVWRREADGKWRLFRGASFPLDISAAK